MYNTPSGNSEEPNINTDKALKNNRKTTTIAKQLILLTCREKDFKETDNLLRRD